MRSLYSILVLSFALSFVGCVKTPPNLTPQAVIAFHSTQAIGYLDAVRDAADRAHKTVPPLISAQAELKVVNWHESMIKVVHDAKDGWRAEVTRAIDELKAGLPPNERQVVGSYLDAAKLIIQEVQ